MMLDPEASRYVARVHRVRLGETIVLFLPREALERWRRIAREAARQCGRGDAPEVTGPLCWGDALGAAEDERALRLCLWERAVNPIGPELRALGAEQPLVVAVGPEGGLEDEE